MPNSRRVEIIGVPGIPEIKVRDDLAEVIVGAMRKQGLSFVEGDVLMVTQKIVSKAEGRVVELSSVEPSDFAMKIARRFGKDPRLVEVILGEARRIVRMDRGIIIVETRQGFVCANGGVDQSNVKRGYVSLLPSSPDRSARRIRNGVRRMTGMDVAVVISDTFGRPWREGQTNVAIGVAGLKPFKDYRGLKDSEGYELKVTVMAVADELASAAELAMGKLDRIPIVIVRGFDYPRGEGSVRELVRPASKDLFR